MTESRNFIVTTTPSLEGYKIIRYLGPVSAHVVAGTGFFSDFAASFSDFFGGFSETYRKQLNRINDEVIKELIHEAQRKGANCVLGLRIDHDEISGQGKQMFMVTGMGTAAVGVHTNEKGIPVVHESIVLDRDDVRKELEKQRLLNKLNSNNKDFDSNTWDFIIQHKMPDFAFAVCKRMEDLSKGDAPLDIRENFYSKAKEYFRVLPEEISKELLYGVLISGQGSSSHAREMIQEFNLLDTSYLRKLLAVPDHDIRSVALAILKSDKDYYTIDDVDDFKKLLNEVRKAFPKKAEFVSEKGSFSSKEKVYWVCQCGNKNKQEYEVCDKCHRDQYFIKSGIPDPETITKLIENKIAALEACFAQTR